MKTAVVYWSGTGNTEAMAGSVAELSLIHIQMCIRDRDGVPFFFYPLRYAPFVNSEGGQSRRRPLSEIRIYPVSYTHLYLLIDTE